MYTNTMNVKRLKLLYTNFNTDFINIAILDIISEKLI